ncbi:MAG: RNA polymerase sigma factor [Candidatus Omnitrophica bacterium]|nr:RNA polymerase sigma factor [Candidatus Omnitrophota bacterium]
MVDEGLLIAKAKNGDLEAFGQIIASLETRLYRVALFLCGEREEAKDLLQETFLGLHQGLPRFAGKSGIYTYTYRILLNLHHKRLRKKRRITVSLTEGLKITYPGLPSAAESFAKTELREKIRVGIAKLPALFQEIIVLRYLEELSYHEIAEMLKVNEGTLKSRLFKAKNLLRNILS